MKQNKKNTTQERYHYLSPIKLNHEEWDNLMQHLENPPEATPALKELLQKIKDDPNRISRYEYYTQKPQEEV